MFVGLNVEIASRAQTTNGKPSAVERAYAPRVPGGDDVTRTKGVPLTNIAPSVRARLLQRAHEDGEDFD